MSNLRHEFYTGFPYHVFNRGFLKQRIFFSDADYARFTARLQFLLDEHPHIHLHAFCLLPNHFHLILSETGLQDLQDRSQPGGISAFMHKLELAYTMYAKTKYREEFPR
jgi:REP element-mobilizing transposase RayT